MYFPVLSTENVGSNDNPLSMIISRAQIVFSNYQESQILGDWLIPDLWQKIDKMSLGYFVGPESKDIVKE